MHLASTILESLFHTTLRDVAKVGSFVDEFVKNSHYALLRSKMGNVLQHVPHIRVGSCCSGWGCLEMLLQELEASWNQTHGAWEVKAGLLHHQSLNKGVALDTCRTIQPLVVQFDLKFMVENDRAKQVYLKQRFGARTHLFLDMKDMGRRSANTIDGHVEIPKAGS